MTDEMRPINLGDKVRDIITGLEGIATARCRYLHGCDHIGIQPPAKDGKVPPIQWVDEPQVKVKKQRISSPSYPYVRRGTRVGGPSTGGNPGERAHPGDEKGQTNYD